MWHKARLIWQQQTDITKGHMAESVNSFLKQAVEGTIERDKARTVVEKTEKEE